MNQIRFALTLVLLMGSSLQAKAEYFILPAAIRLEGVGGIYGAAAGAKRLIGKRVNLIGGASFGEVEAQGILVSDIPFGFENVGLMLGFANISRARFNTTYARGLDSAPVFEQEISGQFFGGGPELRFLDERFKLSLGLVISTINLDDYYIGDAKIERPNKSSYHAIKTSSYFFTTKYDSEPDDIKNGWNVGLSALTANGRVAQSDTLTTTYSLSGRLVFTPRWALVGSARWSDAYITRQEKKYLSSAETKAALNTNCSTIIDANEQAKCQSLEDSLANYIAANNMYGTAAPLGGSNGVQAFDEFSLRAAHTRLLALELRFQIASWLQAVPVYQMGWSADNSQSLYDRSVHSYGGGLRFKIKTLAARLAYAQTHDQSAWFLTIER